MKASTTDRLDEIRARITGQAPTTPTADLLDARELLAEVDRLTAWVGDLQSGMYVNCVYCGHRYGPGETTPVSMADALKAHVERCPKHPLSQARARIEQLEGLLADVTPMNWLDDACTERPVTMIEEPLREALAWHDRATALGVRTGDHVSLEAERCEVCHVSPPCAPGFHDDDDGGDEGYGSSLAEIIELLRREPSLTAYYERLRKGRDAAERAGGDPDRCCRCGVDLVGDVVGVAQGGGAWTCQACARAIEAAHAARGGS